MTAIQKVAHDKAKAAQKKVEEEVKAAKKAAKEAVKAVECQAWENAKRLKEEERAQRVVEKAREKEVKVKGKARATQADNSQEKKGWNSATQGATINMPPKASTTPIVDEAGTNAQVVDGGGRESNIWLIGGSLIIREIPGTQRTSKKGTLHYFSPCSLILLMIHYNSSTLWVAIA